MSFIQPTTFSSTPIPNSNIESQWVIQIQDKIKDVDSNNQVSIFNVPKTLSASDPESYIPQQVAIGPYHYFHPQLCEMERNKVAAAKSTERQLQILDFNTLVAEFVGSETKIRGCYHKFLDVKDKTLRWMMAINASFLLEFLLAYGIKHENAVPSLDYSMRMLAHDNAILRDIVMLENQIPLFVLIKVLELIVPKTLLQIPFPTASGMIKPEDLLLFMSMELFKDLTPLKAMVPDPPKITESAHLLDFMYHMITPKEMVQNPPEIISKSSKIGESEYEAKATPDKKKYYEKYFKYADMAKEFAQKKGREVVSATENVPGPRPLNNLFKVTKAIYSFAQTGEEMIKWRSSSKEPLAEEISIPSVSDLAEAGVRFVPKEGGIEAISFDSKTGTFNLPRTTLDVNTNVVLRNLVAYEAASKSTRPLVLARYTELMNGIIDTEEDAKLLREKGIIFNHLKSDEEVIKLWNGMSRSIKLTKVYKLDRVIEEVNKYYNSRLKVKAKKMLRIYVYSFWKLLAFLASLVILLLVALQSFCSVYSCTTKLAMLD